MMAVTRRAVVLLLCGFVGVLAYSAPAFAGALLLAGPLESPAGSPTKTLGAAPAEAPKTGPAESPGPKSGAPGVAGSEAGGVIQSAPSPPPGRLRRSRWNRLSRALRCFRPSS